MTLLLTREDFARQSGRHDLVTDFAAATYTDNGANFFIQAGQRFLDRRQETPKSRAWYKKDIAVGDYKLEFAIDAIAIYEVWMADADGRKELEEHTLAEMMDAFQTPYADLDNGTLKYYANVPVGLAPEQAALTAVGGGSPYTDQFTYDFENLKFEDHFSTRAILLLPPTDLIKTISVFGRFHSKVLSADTDKTYWTERENDILVLAALYALERHYRNREGMRDYLAAIDEALDGVDKDLAEEDLTSRPEDLVMDG